MKWNKATTKLPDIGRRYLICEEGMDRWMEGVYFQSGSTRDGVKYMIEGWHILMPKDNAFELVPLHGTGCIEKVWYADPKIPAKIKERM